MATKIVKTLKFPNNTDEFQINAARLGGKTIEDIQSELDLKVSLVGTGTDIPSGTNLNTVDYLKVGYYICDKSTTANSLVNCPVNKAFMMQVYSPFSDTIDNETSISGVYRIRKIEGYDANEYVQFCSSPSGTTEWTYGEWEKIINTGDVATTSKAGVMSAADKTKLNGIATGANKTTVDTTVSDTSSNPIANKTIKSYVDTKVANIVNSAPETLDTLNELAAALGDDPNFATTVATQIGNKVDKVSGKGLSTNDYTTAEKNKLVGIAEGANKTIVDSAISSDSTNPVQNKVISSALEKKSNYSGTQVSPQEAKYYAKICTIDLPKGYNDMYFEFDLAGRTHTRFQNVKCTIFKANTTVDNIGLRVSGPNDNVYKVCAYRYVDTTNGDYTELWCEVPSWDTLNIIKKTFAANGSIQQYLTWDMSKNTALPTESDTVIKVNASLEKWSGNAATATALTSSAGSATQPIYFKDGKPVATTYTLGKSVPSDAKFTDTTYSAAGSSLGLVKSGGDVTISSGVITVNDDSHNHVISNVDGLQTALDKKFDKTGGSISGPISIGGDGGGYTINPAGNFIAGPSAGTWNIMDKDSNSKFSVAWDTGNTKIKGTLTVAGSINGNATSASSAAKLTGLTASRALVSDSSGNATVSAVTSTEIGYLDGVTSNIQTQLNNKAAVTFKTWTTADMV